ncbi:conserved Plasmodium protein, unknown function [Plasmodium ovale]|uniref:Uncharacterized protein n=1 Tax=Plasmodium ovale TaxID=36330 RepID=A0A1D3TIK5_PLAOA|nr:conserved Plasmodium protein, unknown function [Plasmodium ovale]
MKFSKPIKKCSLSNFTCTSEEISKKEKKDMYRSELNHIGNIMDSICHIKKKITSPGLTNKTEKCTYSRNKQKEVKAKERYSQSQLENKKKKEMETKGKLQRILNRKKGKQNPNMYNSTGRNENRIDFLKMSNIQNVYTNTNQGNIPQTGKFSNCPMEKDIINSFLKTKCILKKINGDIKEINIKDINTTLPNYIPYRKKEDTNISAIFKTGGKFTSAHNTTLETLTNLPTVYEKVHMDWQLVQKCREASLSRNASINNCHYSDKAFSKIKLSVERSVTGSTGAYSGLMCGECYNWQDKDAQRTKVAAFACPHKLSRSFSCSIVNCNTPSKGVEKINRAVSQKLIVCNAEKVYNTPVGEAKFRGFENEMIKFESVQDSLKFHSSEVKHIKSVVSPDINSIKENLTPMVLKHSKNMILSKLRSLNSKRAGSSRHGENSPEDRVSENATGSPRWNSPKRKNNKHKPSYMTPHIDKHRDNKEENEHTPYNNNLLPYSYRGVLNDHKKEIHEKTKLLFVHSDQNVTLEKILAEKPRVKSIEKKKYIERINGYKVIYKSDDFVSIYKKEDNRTIGEQCFDVSSLLCKPGYVGNYLCESNSTFNDSNVRENQKVMGTLEDDEYDREHANDNAWCMGKKCDRLTYGGIYTMKENTATNEPHAFVEGEQLNTMDDLEKDDKILYHLTKAINSSPTLNVDLQYILIFNDMLQKQKSTNDEEELLPVSANTK